MNVIFCARRANLAVTGFPELLCPSIKGGIHLQFGAILMTQRQVAYGDSLLESFVNFLVEQVETETISVSDAVDHIASLIAAAENLQNDNWQTYARKIMENS